MYRVERELLNAVNIFYVGSEAIVKINGRLSEWFAINVGFRQGCVISPRLFNVYI